jgi:alkanesulfonate monooxygenase SsuD/methylene tetrahydromethanopterin reductase-like flavin-dependent oxidoreductase (luciferase family)
MTAQLDRICEEAGRDPASIGRSVGVFVEPGDEHLAEAAGFGTAITGSINHIADTIARFAEVGVTRVEVVPWPPTVGTVEKVASIFTSLQ